MVNTLILIMMIKNSEFVTATNKYIISEGHF